MLLHLNALAKMVRGARLLSCILSFIRNLLLLWVDSTDTRGVVILFNLLVGIGKARLLGLELGQSLSR